MPEVYPFQAIQYKQGKGDVSALVAPPYDVLDAQDKKKLLSRDARNVVAIDLPHVPAKELGPPEAYQGAAEQLQRLLAEGVLSRRETPAMFVYRQSFEFAGKDYQRTGMTCCVETAPFGPRQGGGILPHEQTFSGPKEDRLALMRATRTQTSPIFGLHADDDGQATALLQEIAVGRKPDLTAKTADGVAHELWTVDDDALVARYREALDGEDVFIADGHHRYTTALNYLAELESQGAVEADHPARRTMIVLVGMSDPGLAIGPTHRVLGGMRDYTWGAFETAASKFLNITPLGDDPRNIADDMEALSEGLGEEAITLGLIDLDSGHCYFATTKADDPLAERFGDKPEAWRKLEVSIIQHLIVERICEPELNAGEPVKWAFPHSVDEIMRIAEGEETGAGGGQGFGQLAVVVRPTPLGAVREISAAGELMPQKSTFFYPKLATGLCLNPLHR